MPSLKFTATWVVGALAPGEYVDLSLPNFGLMVLPSGRRFYWVRIREAGKRIRITLGPAPHPGMAAAEKALTLSLAEARAAATEKLRLHRDGAILRPPVVVTAADADAAQLRPDTLTGAQLAAVFLAKQGGRIWAKGTATCHKDYLARLYVPTFGHRLVTSVTRQEIRALLDSYAKVGNVAANRAHGTICRMYRWAFREAELILVNPVADLAKPGIGADAEVRRARVLTHDEIRYFWAELDKLEATTRSNRDRVQVGVWRLRLLTAQRGITLRRLRWAWVNFREGFIAIPPDALKRKKQPVPHLIPMAPRIRAILEARAAAAHPTDLYVFGSRPGQSKLPTPSRGLQLDLPDFQGKDLRRTATTLMRTHGNVKRGTVKWILNHKISDVTGIYDRYDMYDQKLAGLTKLDAIVTAILNPNAKRAASLLRFPARVVSARQAS
jgi:integrase